MKIGDRVEGTKYPNHQATVCRLFEDNPKIIGVKFDFRVYEYMQDVLGYSIVQTASLRLMERATEGDAMKDAMYEKVGTFGVDSGSVMVVDPAYVVYQHATADELSDRLQAMVTQLQAGGQMDLRTLGLMGDGVAAYTVTGDGVYSVYRVMVEGKYVGLFVDLAGTLDLS